MSLISIVVTLVIVGVVLWLINTYIPMAGSIKSILNVVVIIVVAIWLLQAFGVLGHINGINIKWGNLLSLEKRGAYGRTQLLYE